MVVVMDRQQIETLADTVARSLWDRDERAYWGGDDGMRPLDPDSPDEDLAEAARSWLETVREVLDHPAVAAIVGDRERHAAAQALRDADESLTKTPEGLDVIRPARGNIGWADERSQSAMHTATLIGDWLRGRAAAVDAEADQ